MNCPLIGESPPAQNGQSEVRDGALLILGECLEPVIPEPVIGTHKSPPPFFWLKLVDWISASYK